MCWSHLPSLFLFGAIKGMMPTFQQWSSWLWLEHVLLPQKWAVMLKGGIWREYLGAGMASAPSALHTVGASQWQAAFSEFTATEFITVTQEAWPTNKPQVTTAALPAQIPLNL